MRLFIYKQYFEMKSIAMLLVTAAVANQHHEDKLSVPLKKSVGEGKMTHMADRSLNKRSSDKPKSAWSMITDNLFGASTSHRTEFDRRVDSYIEREQFKAQKKQLRSGKKALKATTIDHDLIYAVDLPMFLGELRLGAEATLLDLVFDTGSDWLVVPDIDCASCDGNQHDSNVSGQAVDENLSERNYGSASLVGSTYRDKACLSAVTSSCVNNFEYFSFIEQTGINSPIEGILGMAQNKQMMLSSQEMEVGPLFANELYKQGKVPTPSFSFAMKGYTDDDSSIVDFGIPDL